MIRYLYLAVFVFPVLFFVEDTLANPLDKSVINEASLEYVGAFDIPIYANEWSTAYSYGAFAHRYVDGKLRFFLTSHVYSGGLVYEINYPGISKTPPYPKAEVVQEWGDIYDGHKWVGNDGGSATLNSGIITYGLFYDSTTERLYWNYGHWYNTTNPDNPCIGFSVLDDDSGTATAMGAWRLSGVSEKFGRSGTLRIPQWFADQYLNGKGLAVGMGGYYSIVSNGGIGPSLIGIDQPDPSTNPDRSSLASRPLVQYPFNSTPYTSPGRPRRDTNYTDDFDGWNPRDGIGYWHWNGYIYDGGAWIDTPDVHGLLYIAKEGDGRNWYETSNLHAEKGKFSWYVYNPKDIAAVAEGDKATYDIQPTFWADDGTLPISADADGFDGTGGNHASVEFDPVANRLYVHTVHAYKQGCCEWYPRVYVYDIKSSVERAPHAPFNLRIPSTP